MIKLENKDLTSSFRDTYVQTLDQLIRENEKTMVLEADLMKSSSTDSLFKKYPNQCVNFGISEANMIGAAAGMSKAGFLPFAHSFAPFITRRPLDQLYMSVAYSNNSLFVYASDAGIFSQRNGGTHTTNEDLAIATSMPNCMVFSPSDPVSFKWLMNQYSKQKGFFYVRGGRKNTIQHLYTEDSTFEVGKSIIVHQGTSKVAIIAEGMMVFESLLAKELLLKENIDPTIIDIFSIKPLDEKLIAQIISVSDLVLVAENHSRYGGVGSLVAYEIAKSDYNPIFKHIAIDDKFGEVGSLDYLKEKFKLRASDIAQSIVETINRRNQND